MKIKQGISLIVLVITIIVMVILTGAVVLTLNNSGIISKAEDAVEQTNLATVRELAQMAWASAYSLGATEQELQQAVDKAFADSNIDTSKYMVEVTTSGVTVELKGAAPTIPSNWQANVVAIVDTVPIPKGFVASSVAGENKKAGGLVIYEGTEPVTDANVEEAKRTRNQYVWVPVEDFSKFVRDDFSQKSNTPGEEYTYWEIELDLATNMPKATQNEEYITAETTAEAIAMYESVKEYKGFYIGRYEANSDGTSTYSMMGKEPSYGWSKQARAAYVASNNNYGVVSTLTYGVQWDVTKAWFKEMGITEKGNYANTVIAASDLNEGAMYAILGDESPRCNYPDYCDDGDAYCPEWDYCEYPEFDPMNTTWVGFYNDVTTTFNKDATTSMALTTGALKTAKVNNIYDMSGNFAEITMEQYTEDSGEEEYHFNVKRGGSYYRNDDREVRGIGNMEGEDDYSFRVSLYIKK